MDFTDRTNQVWLSLDVVTNSLTGLVMLFSECRMMYSVYVQSLRRCILNCDTSHSTCSRISCQFLVNTIILCIITGHSVLLTLYVHVLLPHISTAKYRELNLCVFLQCDICKVSEFLLHHFICPHLLKHLSHSTNTHSSWCNYSKIYLSFLPPLWGLHVEELLRLWAVYEQKQVINRELIDSIARLITTGSIYPRKIR